MRVWWVSQSSRFPDCEGELQGIGCAFGFGLREYKPVCWLGWHAPKVPEPLADQRHRQAYVLQMYDVSYVGKHVH